MKGGAFAGLRDKFNKSERCVEVSCLDRAAGALADADKLEPPDRAEIGRAAWRYLHSMAASFPEEPTEREQEDAQAWMASFVQFYPCQHCASDFVDIIEEAPPRTGSRDDYAVWWCEAHNKVSQRLHKAVRRCVPAQLVANGLAGLTMDETPPGVE
mmetsp:Transcript_14485/g.31493  ORF Transcript_14485/g.31493 Transcript_14485/m.31493 type:complete len:156 (+) Transcript_14485:66-533(+)